MMFTADIDFLENSMFSIGTPLGNRGSAITTATYAAPRRSFSWSDFASAAAGFRPAIQGDRLHLSGSANFERRESGWVAVDVKFAYEHDSTKRAAGRTDSESKTENAHVAYMKSDLRNLITAQEAYFSDHSSTYAPSVDVLGRAYRASTGVTIVIGNMSANVWTATANHRETKTTCTISLGGTASNEGAPVCR